MMRVSAAILGVSMLWLLGAGCGKPFTIGVGGSGGGGAAVTGVTASATSTSSSGGSEACDPNGQGGGCSGDEFCFTTDCKTGTCAPAPEAMGAAYDPVCGCDGIAYWNADLAINDGVGFLERSACDIKTLNSCNPFSPTPSSCDPKNNVYCNMRLYTSCAGTPNGVCMRIPSDCESTDKGGKECLDPTGECRLACELVREQRPWFMTEPSCTP